VTSGHTPVSLLVTGVGDTVGQGLVKAARQSLIPCRVIGTDRQVPCVGLQWVDAGFVLPHSSRGDEYLAEVRRICRAEAVQLILPGSEKELELLAQNAAAIGRDTGAIVVASALDVLRVAMDKWETCRFLERAGLAFPGYARIDVLEEIERLVATVGFPLIAKPFRGTGSRGVYEVDSWQEIDFARGLGKDMVLQERLEPDHEEYSVEVYTRKDGAAVGAISYRREQLVAGDTYRARVGSNAVVEAEALRVVKALRPTGPCNVQLRWTARGPVTFEINPRFSGGVGMRAHFGYNEVEMAIRDLALDEPVPAPRTTTGTALRFWEEMYFDDGPQPATPNRGYETVS
jgi:carbamoyl-phosphate synthase large subunit